VPAQFPLGGRRLLAMVEEAVDGRPGAAYVRTEGALRAQLVRERRGREVVGWERNEVSRAADLPERFQQRSAPLRKALLAAALVEGRVDGGRRILSRAPRQEQDDPVVLGERELRQLGTGSFGELRSGAQEEGDVRTKAGRDLAQLCGR
jgi:hypothetical protein